MNLEELNEYISYSTKKLGNRFKFLTEASIEYTPKEPKCFHIDIKFVSDFPKKFLEEQNMIKANPWIGFDFDLNNPDEKQIKDCIGIMFLKSWELFETVELNISLWNKYNEHSYIK